MIVSRLAPTWTELRRLGESKLLHSAYLWFFLVPVAAKILTRLDDGRVWWVQALGLSHMGLPFNWEMFFFASLFVALANSVYFAFCPRVIREAPNWLEFASQKRTPRGLLLSFAEVLVRSSLVHGPHWWRHAERMLKEHVLRFASNASTVRAELNDGERPRTASRLVSITCSIELLEGAHNDVASFTWDLAEENFPVARVCCAAAYALGGLCIVAVAIQNTIAVVKAI